MTTRADQIKAARVRQREELLRLGLRLRRVPREQKVRWPHLSLEEQRADLMRRGEDPDWEEVWEYA